MKAGLTASARRAHGFTLMEVMITAAIIAILASLAYPSYRDSIQRARRADAQRALIEAAQFMRKFHSARDTYAGATLPAALQQSPRPGDGAAAYQIRLVEGNNRLTVATAAQTFTLIAVRTGTMAGDRCGDLLVADTGATLLIGAQAGQTLAGCFRGQ